MVAVLAILWSPAIAWTRPFVFTAIPDDNEARLRERFDKVAAYLSKQLKVEVKYAPVKTYAASVAGFKNNQVQMAWFGGLSGIQARLAVPGSRAIVQGEEDRHFTTYFIANTGTGLKEGAELSKAVTGKTFTFGAKDSTSGRLMPEFFIRETFKKPPEQVFSRVGFSGDHSKTIALVQSGAYDVGAVNYTVWNLDVKQGKVDTSKVAIIWKTPTFQDYQFTVRGDVDKEYGTGFSARLTQVLLDLRDPDLLASFPRKAFVPAKNEDYEQLRAVAKSVGLID
ncbi:MAG TPA: putative selenate ABC transporter substrate-binding protein [Polyangia bacterium]|nr:putative selenate ABC transporter substrate-binding protein [Polyangia bacterium]